MRLQIGNSFILEVQPTTIFVRLPLIGQAFIGGGMTALDGWRTLRATGEI